MVPNIEVTAVPIPSNQQARRNGDATDVIRHGELELELECALAPALDHTAAVRAVLRYGHPQRFRVGGDSAGMEALTVLNLDGSQQLTSLQREFVQIAFPARSIDRSHP